MYQYIVTILFFIVFITGQYAQNRQVKDSIITDEMYYIALKPSKAGFYSAILPGLGQVYNKDYIKVPLVYGALASSFYFYNFNHKRYKSYREAFKLLKLGEPNEYPYLSSDVLQKAQAYHKKNRDLSFLIAIGLYALQIVEASVDAHLQHHNTDASLGVSPTIWSDDIITNDKVYGISLTYTF